MENETTETPTERRIMRILREANPDGSIHSYTWMQLADLTCSCDASIKRTVRRLETLGWVRRTQVDGRTHVSCDPHLFAAYSNTREEF